MVRIGVIGLGFMGATHIAAIEAARGAVFPCELVAVCDRKAARRRGELWDVRGNAVSDVSQRKLAFDPQHVRGYERADELLDDPEIDLVCICTHTDTHIELATRALRAGKHVLVEKPVDLDPDKILELDRVAKEAGRLCMPAMCMRFWPAWAWLKARIEDRQFGMCSSATFTRLASMPRWSRFFADASRSGGALVDLHIHDTDFVYWCFGNPQSVASSGTVVAGGAIDHVTTLYHFPRRTGFQSVPLAQQMHRLKTRATEGDDPTHITAEGGWDHHDGFAFRMRYIAIFEHATADFDLTRDPPLLLCSDGKSEAVALVNLSGYDLQLRHLVDAIEQGEKSTLATLEDSAEVIKILDDEKRSVLQKTQD